ncbi:hypothetical protein B566_EDAN006693 [Ephemera danica]|nr:hypothetical protein B566_EDAN006693 [Ephemera danica]
MFIKGSPWQYRAPSSTIESHSEEQWNAVLQTAQLEAEELLPPPDLFQDGVEIVSHELECGMKLEALHPVNKIEVCPATVTRLFETGHFTVHIDSLDEREEGDEQISWICRPGDPFLFPPGWTSDLAEFDWDEYLKHTKAIPAPDSFFPKMELATDMDFAIGQKLEAVNPENQHQICAASISRLVGHLIWVHLDSEESYLPSHVVSTDSNEIFPVGWCGSNNYPLMPPKNYQAICKTEEDPGKVKEPTASQQENIQKSSWCPKIYFNHKCFTGPFLSKGKLALLPKSVGPGPVTLVLREVLSMLISVAYKSRQVLKELQLEGPLPKDMHLEVLKAKLKSAVYRANVGIATSADKVSSYCQDVCAKLQSCPNLFGPELYADNCPVGCSALSKSRFTNYWSKHKSRSQQAQACSSVDPALKPKKRGRKKLLTRPKSHSNADDRSKRDKLDDDDMDSEECDTPSRPDSGNGDASSKKRIYKKKLFPQFEMRTRGTKLPNFALKMTNWTWGKESYIPSKKQSRTSSDTTNQDLKRRSTRRLSPPSSLSGKRKRFRLNNLRLTSNPLRWSVDDVAHYLRQTPDCGTLAGRLAEEDIDGHAFMLLNLPTVQENLHLQLSTAIKLCQHVERVKFAYFSDYCNKVLNTPS